VNGTTESRSQSVLYTCSYVPEENILAAGSQPRRFLPEGLLADAYVHPSRCGYVKSMLGAAVERAAVGGRRAPSRASGPESIVTTVTSSRDPRAPSRWAVHEEPPESEKAGSWRISGEERLLGPYRRPVPVCRLRGAYPSHLCSLVAHSQKAQAVKRTAPYHNLGSVEERAGP
jgi:hypothetical protein